MSVARKLIVNKIVVLLLFLTLAALITGIFCIWLYHSINDQITRFEIPSTIIVSLITPIYFGIIMPVVWKLAWLLVREVRNLKVENKRLSIKLVVNEEQKTSNNQP
jgi:hypothetical protein